MTLDEMRLRATLKGEKVYAVIDGCGESAEIGLYQKNADDFEDDEALDWPDDWPEWVSVKFIKELGLEVLTA